MRHLIGAAVVVCAAALGWAILDARTIEIAEPLVAGRPIQLSSAGYVSSDTCRACHPVQYDTWHASFHRTMTQRATPDTVRAEFDRVRVDVVSGNRIVLSRRGNEFWAELDDPDWSGEGAGRPRIERQIVMVTGSHYQQVYWYRTGRTRVLGQLPATYLIAERQWIPRDAALLHPPLPAPSSETARWNAVCDNCHATGVRRRFEAPDGPPGSGIAGVTADTQVGEFGVACEACHGPAEEHVRRNRAPLHRYAQHLRGAPDRGDIVQPARLSAARSSQVCGQCHGVWEYADADAERRANDTGFPYRPGGELRDSRFVVQPSTNREAPVMRAILAAYPGYLADSFWPDGMIRVSGREYNGLIDSPCFRNAATEARTLSCSSCHTLHKNADDPRTSAEWAGTHQVSAGKADNEACLHCHEGLRAALESHTKHAPSSSGTLCYNCHMPYTTYGLLRAQRSHQISSPSVASSVETGRPNACNACHLDKTLAWTAEYLQTWYGIPAPALSGDQRSVAASLLWLLRGDAGQRALAAWSMGWAPAQAASGTDWIAPSLAMLLNDPYDAVRFVAVRSLRSLPGFATTEIDFLAPPRDRLVATARALDRWRRLPPLVGRRVGPELLLDDSGAPRLDQIARLGLQRDDRPVVLRE